jgi:APA family basic amino acid/polyamine antiporter
MKRKVELKRTLTLPILTLYGLGTIIGAGIYVLIGKVAAVSSFTAVYAFLFSGIIAGLSALSFAELSSRYPKSAGEAVYVSKAFGRPRLAQIVGWFVVFTGIVSSATLMNGFYGYLQVFWETPFLLTIAVLVFSITALSAWGIQQSTLLIAFITLLEIGGLLYVMAMASGGQGASWGQIFEIPWSMTAVSQMVVGGFLAFYAFIGFEDMVNVAEEVKSPRKNMPRAIVLAIVCSTVLYISVAAVTLRHMPMDQLAQSTAPLADVISQSGYSSTYISFIALVAVINGALVQLIMASRVLYGLGQQKMAPDIFSKLNAKTQTPLWGTAIIGFVLFIFAIGLPLVTLAKIASFIMLMVFTLVNLSLVFVKIKHPKPQGVIMFPFWVPILATILCITILLWQFF